MGVSNPPQEIVSPAHFHELRHKMRKMVKEVQLNQEIHFEIVDRGKFVPLGKSVATVSEAKRYKSEVIKLLGHWSVVALNDGRITGEELGYLIDF